MKNAILPFLIFSTCTAVVTWQDFIQHNNAETKTINVSSDLYDETEQLFNYELPSKGNVNEKSLPKWFTLDISLVELLNMQSFLKTNMNQRQALVIELLKHKIQAKAYSEVVDATDLLNTFSKSNAIVLFYVALSHSRQGHIDDAIELYNKVLTLDPLHLGSRINLALLLKKQKNYLGSNAVLEKAVEEANGERKAKMLSIMSTNYYQLNQFDQGALLAEKSLEYRPDHAFTWFQLGRMRDQLAFSYSDTVTAFERASRLAPDDWSYVYELGHYHLKHLNFQLAESNLVRAAELQPNKPKVRRALAWVLFENNKLNHSIKEWRWIAKNEKSKIKREAARNMLDLLSEDPDRMEKALKQIDALIHLECRGLKQKLCELSTFGYQKLIGAAKLHMPVSGLFKDKTLSKGANSPFDYLFALRYAQALGDSGKRLDAIESLKKLLNNNLYQPTVAKQLAFEYAAIGEFFKSNKQIALAQFDNSFDPELFDLQINNLLAVKDYGRVMRLVNGQKYPSVNAIRALAESHMMLGDLTSAKSLYRQVVEKHRDDFHSFFQLAQIEVQRNNQAEALNWLSESLHIKGDYLPARELHKTIVCVESGSNKCQQEKKIIAKMTQQNQQATTTPIINSIN